MSDFKEQAAEAVLATLRKAAESQSFTLPGPVKLFAHHGEDSAKQGKTVAFNGGIDLLFKGVRRGKRSAYIFEFEQMDSDEWPVIDVQLKDADRYLPKFGMALASVCAKFGEFEDMDTAGWSLTSYVDWFVTTTAERLEREEQERIAEAAVKQSERYADNDAWGQW